MSMVFYVADVDFTEENMKTFVTPSGHDAILRFVAQETYGDKLNIRLTFEQLRELKEILNRHEF